MNEVPPVAPRLACIILAHADPVHLRRLIQALEPFPIFLHIDDRTPDATFAAMTADLPSRCTVLKRTSTAWAQWGLVAAELEGYRTALDSTDATHFALFSGADYPLASAREIVEFLEEHIGESFARVLELPIPQWGKSGGLARLRYRHWAFGKRMLRLPIPRRLPRGIVLSGGSQSKVLARDHARAVVDIADGHRELTGFWRRSWVPDETFVYSILNTPRLVPGWKSQLVSANLWWIGWESPRQKSPPVLHLGHRDHLLSQDGQASQQIPFLFARKFSTGPSTPVLDAIDAHISLHPQKVVQP